MLDIKKIVYDELIKSSIPYQNIYLDNDCTHCKASKYFSYRREGEIAGRMVAITGWNFS